MKSLFGKFILDMIRHALTFGGGVIVSDGWLNSNDAAQLVGALMTIISIAWSLIQKHQDHVVIRKAELVKLPDSVAQNSTGK